MAKSKKNKGSKASAASNDQSSTLQDNKIVSTDDALPESHQEITEPNAAAEGPDSVQSSQRNEKSEAKIDPEVINEPKSSNSDDLSTNPQSSLGRSMEANMAKEAARDPSHHLQNHDVPDENSKAEQIDENKEAEDANSGFGDDDDDDDDFGSFDEASFEELEPQTADELTSPSSEGSYVTLEKIEKTLDFLFPKITENANSGPDALLSETADAKFRELSKTPHLSPPNWTKSQLRHSLLLKLGIPINLDEISGTGHAKRRDTVSRTTVSEDSLDWSRFNLPDLESISLSPEAQKELLGQSVDILSRVELENISNISELHLQKSPEEDLDGRLKQMQANYEQLLILSSLWNGQLEDLKASQNVYESVVQSMVGYNQKVQRNELLESLRRSKTKRGKKTF